MVCAQSCYAMPQLLLLRCYVPYSVTHSVRLYPVRILILRTHSRLLVEKFSKINTMAVDASERGFIIESCKNASSLVSTQSPSVSLLLASTDSASSPPAPPDDSSFHNHPQQKQQEQEQEQQPQYGNKSQQLSFARAAGIVGAAAAVSKVLVRLYFRCHK